MQELTVPGEWDTETGGSGSGFPTGVCKKMKRPEKLAWQGWGSCVWWMSFFRREVCNNFSFLVGLASFCSRRATLAVPLLSFCKLCQPIVSNVVPSSGNDSLQTSGNFLHTGKSESKRQEVRKWRKSCEPLSEDGWSHYCYRDKHIFGTSSFRVCMCICLLVRWATSA